MRRLTLILLLIVLASAGCTQILSHTMPPQKIPMDRQNYLEAVSKSWKEQLLSNLVRLRYGDTLTSLEMTNVITGYELDAGATAGYTHGWGLGPSSPFRNSVPIGASVAYSDKPAITYVPTSGDALAKTMIEPLDPSKMLKSLQTGWDARYIVSCCVKSINHLRNCTSSGSTPADPDFFKLVQLIHELKKNGVIRITIEDKVEPKVTKVPKEYTITLVDKRQGTQKSESGKEAIGKGAAKAEQVKEAEEKEEKKKEEKEVIGLLVVDKDRAKSQKLEDQVNEFKRSLWPGASPQGKGLYRNNCSNCHGEKGNGEGPKTSTYDLKPADFNASKFWMGDVDQKITQAVKKGHENMPKIHMKDDHLNAVKAFIKQAFGEYEEYKIIDGNQYIPQPDPNCDKIVLQTRSLMESLRVLSLFIKVPEEHVTPIGDVGGKQYRASQNISYGKPLNAPEEPLNPPIEKKIMFKIESAKEYPKDNFVAIQYSGFWFYIDDKDYDSKDVFSSTAGILSMSQTITGAGKPVLTLPIQ